MELKTRFCTYRELAEAVGCSYQQILTVHSKRIIEMFNIDVSRLPKSGLLPIDACEQYFDVTNYKPTKEKNSLDHNPKQVI